MWTQEQVRDLTTEKVIEECLGLFQIKEHYERQNLDPPAELLADLQLFNCCFSILSLKWAGW